MPGRIIRMDDDNAARSRREGLPERVQVNVPAMIVKHGVAHQLYVIHIGQKIEKRITRRWNQDFVSRIAKQAEDEGVRLAGADGEQEIVGGDLRTSLRVIAAHGVACAFKPTRVGKVLQSSGIAEGADDGRRIVVKAALSRV